MRDVRPPGWYDDPSGDVDRLRWWDGSEWTGVSRARMPHERRPTDQLGPRNVPPDILDSEIRRPRLSGRWAAVLLAIALIGSLVLTGRLPGLARPDRTDASAPTGAVEPTEPGPSDLPVPSVPAPQSPTPVSGRVVDRGTGLSYDVLPGSWQAWDMFTLQGLVSTAGYYRVVQQHTPDGGEYWANVTSGPIAPTVVRADLRTTARRLAATLDRAYYPPHARRDVAERALTVDGHRAYLVRWVAVFDPRRAAGYDAKSELVVALVVDAGRAGSAGLYISLPDQARSAWSRVDALLASVRVLR